ncbi:MAG: acetyl-CoA carboxylase biotin carboxylase subunit [bacterium]|jgi:acetyl-CoA carboxylase biotin carboxylase subunit
MFKRVLIANRGEIAVRVIRGCRELGCETVAVYSEADAAALHVRTADKAVLLGPPPAPESYLRADKVIATALENGCDAVHPGYGFLAENAGFAQAVIDAGLAWIGPPPSAIRAMGLKVEARALAKASGAPFVPGFDDTNASDSEFIAAAEKMGWPVMVKASAGGGGKGMRIVHEAAKLPDALAAARREAASAFGDPSVYLEKYIENPRHIEIQVLFDKDGRGIHLGERECSIQRRHQKVVEETPSPAVSAETRARMGAAAIGIAAKVGYVGAGTVEFMMDQSGEFYFLEMNTRLQVEHPVTEFVYGVDLVHEQLRIASGEGMSLRQEDLTPRGHSIEVRVCAEDPDAGFLPQIGRVEVLRVPQAPGVRFDSMLYEGCEISPHYDPLLGKLIVYGESRAAAIARLKSALRETAVLGVTTNLPYLLRLISHPAFAEGKLHTGFIEEHSADLAAQPAGEPELIAAALALAKPAAPQATIAAGAGNNRMPTPWEYLGAWSNT